MSVKALHEELHRLIERKKELYSEKDRLHKQLSDQKSEKQSAYRRAKARVTTAGPFGWFFGTTYSDKQQAFQRAKQLGRDMETTYDRIRSCKYRLNSVRSEINSLKEQLFGDN